MLSVHFVYVTCNVFSESRKESQISFSEGADGETNIVPAATCLCVVYVRRSCWAYFILMFKTPSPEVACKPVDKILLFTLNCVFCVFIFLKTLKNFQIFTQSRSYELV